MDVTALYLPPSYYCLSRCRLKLRPTDTGLCHDATEIGIFHECGPLNVLSISQVTYQLVLRHILRKISSFVCLLARVLLLFLVPWLS